MSRRPKRHCAGLKKDGTLKAHYEWKRGHRCPVKKVYWIARMIARGNSRIAKRRAAKEARAAESLARYHAAEATYRRDQDDWG